MTAAEVLLMAGVSSLPVDMKVIAAANGIKLMSYESCAECYDMDIGQMYREISPLGFSFRDEEGYVAAVNANACGKHRRRWTMAHEISHILLGHVSTEVKGMDEGCERSADRFAAELLAPLPVLHFCCVSSAEELGRLCGISRQAAEIRFRQLTELRRKSSVMYRQGGTAFLRSETDSRLLERFLTFVSEYISRRSVHDGYEEHLKRTAGHSMEIVR